MRLAGAMGVLIALLAVIMAGCGGATDTPPPEPPPTPSPSVTTQAKPEPEPATAQPTPSAIPTPTPTPSSSLPLTLGPEPDKTPPLTDASVPQNVPDRPGGAHGFSHYVFEEVGGRVVTTLIEGPREGQVRLPVSYQALKTIYDSGQAREDLTISYEELEELVQQLDTVRDATEKYRDVRVALSEGYLPLTGQVPNMGAHFVHPGRALDGIFDPSEPEILLYVKDEAGKWQLVGTSFVLSTEQVGLDHPDAFAGPLDNWHVHLELCTGPNVTSRSATADECAQQGGIYVPAYGWMIHAWVWKDNPLGVFQMWNPNVPPVATPEEVKEAVSQEADQASSIQNFQFGPVYVKAGETLSWTNVDGVPHTITAGERGVANGGFSSGVLQPGQSFETTFDIPGQYSFTCSLHPFMTGTVVVSE